VHSRIVILHRNQQEIQSAKAVVEADYKAQLEAAKLLQEEQNALQASFEEQLQQVAEEFFIFSRSPECISEPSSHRVGTEIRRTLSFLF
jgi:hypothetical protein